MNPVIHFEMPAKNKARVKKLYESVFGWTLTQLGSDMGDYIYTTTTRTDVDAEGNRVRLFQSIVKYEGGNKV
jgi:uncharacterized protein